MLRFWRLLVSDDLKQWATSGKSATLMFLYPFALLLVAEMVRIFDRPHWSSYWQENGPAEWAQVGFLLIAVVFSFLVARQLMRLLMRLYASLFFIASIGLAFIVGEEVAWGQGLLQFDTPAALINANYKAEMSVHNVTALVAAFDIGKFLMAAYGTFAVMLMRLWRNARDIQFLSLLAPPTFLGSSFALVLVMRVARWTYFRDHAPTGYGEFEELCLYFGLAAYVWLVFRRTQRFAQDNLSVAPA